MGGDRIVIQATIEDAEHFTPERRAQIIASYPAHEREARVYGIPTMGSGRVFPVMEETITSAVFSIPDWWPVVGGLDFGWDHPFAAVQLAHDRDTDTVYVTKAYRIREATPLIHAAAIKPWGNWFYWSWPHDGLQHDKGSGEQLAELYRKQGLRLHSEHAQFADERGHGLEAGITMMLERMLEGRLKVFSNLTQWFEEFRLYHRVDGKIVKERDDLISATRYALMMLRIARGKSAAPIMDRYARKRSNGTGSAWSA